MTLPSAYSWSGVGERIDVPYEANAGRRLNMIGAYFSHGPLAGRLEYELYLGLPKSRAKATKGQIVTLPTGVSAEEVGPIDAQRLLAFIWRIAGRPAAGDDEAEGDTEREWQRERPLYIWLDNYSVHTAQGVKDAGPALQAAGIHLRYLPPYSPELSAIEPIWTDVKYFEMPQRSFDDVLALRACADAALQRKVAKLLAARSTSEDSLRPGA